MKTPTELKEDRISGLFRNFQPEVSPEPEFLSRLEAGMKRLEIVRQHAAEMRRRNRIAVVVAALGGFLTGVLLMMLSPVAVKWAVAIALSMPRVGTAVAEPVLQVTAWIVIGVASALTAVYCYLATLSRLGRG